MIFLSSKIIIESFESMDLGFINNTKSNHPIIDTGCTKILELNYTFSKIFLIDGSSIYYQIKSSNILFKLSILHRNIGNRLHFLQNLRNLSYHSRALETLGQPSSTSSATSSLLAARIPRILPPFPALIHTWREHTN